MIPAKKVHTATEPSANGANALIITPEHHPLTLEMIDSDALHVLRKLNNAGFTGYLVGGGVRDLYLGKKPKDFDIATSATPEQVKQVLPSTRIIGRRFRLAHVRRRQSVPQGRPYHRVKSLPG